MSLGKGGVTDELCFLKYHKGISLWVCDPLQPSVGGTAPVLSVAEETSSQQFGTGSL